MSITFRSRVRRIAVGAFASGIALTGLLAVAPAAQASKGGSCAAFSVTIGATTYKGDRNVTLDTPQGRVFVQVFGPPRRCFVIGAVHIAQPLVRMLGLADYQAIVIDPRESFATESRFPGLELSTEWPDEALERLRPDHRSAVVT